MEVVSALFTDGERVLACRRHERLQAGGRWEFPGGKVEPDEDPAAALRREIAEELAVEIAVGELFDRTTTMSEGTEITLSCYHVWPVAEAPESSTDHTEVAWFQRERLLWLNWAEPDLAAVRRLALPCPPTAS